MPLTEKGEEILSEMKEQYGEKKGEQVFYASENKGTITGVHNDDDFAMGEGPKSSEDPPPDVQGLPSSARPDDIHGPPVHDAPEIIAVLPPTMTVAEINERNRRYWEQTAAKRPVDE
jgi:hypothetical protein